MGHLRRRGNSFQFIFQHGARQQSKNFPALPGETKRQAQKRLGVDLAALEQKGKRTPPRGMRVADLCQRYLEAHQPAAPLSRIRYRYAFEHYICPVPLPDGRIFGDILLRRLESTDIDALRWVWQNAWYGDTTSLSASTVAGHLCRLKEACAWAKKRGWLDDDPAELVELPAIEETLRDAYEPWEVMVIAAVLPEPYGAFFALACGTGLRHGEILGLAWPAVDLDAATARIVQQAQRLPVEGIVIRGLKGAGQKRTIDLPEWTCHYLRQHRVWQKERRAKTKNLWQGDDHQLLFTSAWGAPVDQAQIRTGLKREIEAAGFRYLPPHSGRHTYASMAGLTGESLKTLQQALGHKNAALTMSRYQHLFAGSGRRLAEGIDRLLAAVARDGQERLASDDGARS